LLSHPKGSQLLGAMFGGMGGMGGGMDFGMGGDDVDMPSEEPKSKPSTYESKPSKAEPKPDPTANMSEEEKKAEGEKALGNQAYKKKDFEVALKHYEKASELNPSNITYDTNKAGMF
jgi:stress-induced-phosphoprotein 1